MQDILLIINLHISTQSNFLYIFANNFSVLKYILVATHNFNM